MARRRRTSTFEDLISLAALLPWWASLLIALVSWFLLHGFATSAPPAITHPNQFSTAMTGTVLRSLAMVGQFLIPLAFVFGAIGSIFGRAKRKKLIKDVAAATQPGKTVEGISWREFEQLVGEAFRRKGFTVTESGGGGPDGGVDLVLHLGTDKYLVQCKQWKAIKVGVTVIREFFGVMAAEGAAGGFVVTSGTYTEEAKAFAQGRNIQLVDGTLLKRWIASRSGPTQPTAATPEDAKPSTRSAVPICPVCSSSMILRTAKRGMNLGNQFWGCAKYPACRGIRQLGEASV
ncbi:restriction endonuclease [Pseudomonas sp. Q1-7]|uniref:restriction endonuclease n=1 Tax=Pseudomonas sp. Q1-7 TaxID=3020843 RepID=UPI002301C801|nr:restriction endonuclease [Pseudomonas sp. Q1-7]